MIKREAYMRKIRPFFGAELIMEWNGTLCSIRSWLGVKEHRFKLAQILFILSITLGWYIADGYRRGLFLAALLLLDKDTRKINIWERWSGLSKIAGCCLLALGLWVIFIPALCGVQPLIERLRGMARPVEIFLYCIGTLIFAKDEFFDRNLTSIAVVSASFWSLFVFVSRLVVSFSVDRESWIFDKHASFAGIVLVAMLPWILGSIYNSRGNKYIRYTGIAAFPLIIVAILVTYYRSMWVAAIVQILLSAPLALYAFNIKLTKILKTIAILLTALVVITASVSLAGTDVKNELRSNLRSVLWVLSDFDRFTSRRLEIWQEAADLISERKFGGYGWIEYNKVAGIKKHNPHSSYLQAGFHVGIPGMLLYIAALCAIFATAIKNIADTRSGSNSALFAVFLMIAGVMTSGLTEAHFFTSREFLVPFWATITIVISPFYLKSNRQKNCASLNKGAIDI